MAAEGSSPDGSAARILIVDDFKEWRLHVRSLLQKHPEWQIMSEASNGFEAVQMAEKLQTDLILMDVPLFRLNGIGCKSNTSSLAKHEDNLPDTEQRWRCVARGFEAWSAGVHPKSKRVQ